MRAGAVDLVVETSTDVRKSFAWFKPTMVSVQADAVAIGSRFYLNGLPERVYSIVPGSAPGALTFHMRQGLWWQPSITLMPTCRVMPAVPIVLLEAKAGWADFEVVHSINTVIGGTPAGSTVTIVWAPNETEAFEQHLGTWPWDLYVSTVEYGWTRLIQGQMSIVLGDARATIPPFTYPTETPCGVCV